uniref:Uncharacterized protein n=1 Tax=Rhabditophanes sp. KR3021 TaxID=114890 RepID=A0AC35TVU2_9BILA
MSLIVLLVVILLLLGGAFTLIPLKGLSQSANIDSFTKVKKKEKESMNRELRIENEHLTPANTLIPKPRISTPDRILPLPESVPWYPGGQAPEQETSAAYQPRKGQRQEEKVEGESVKKQDEPKVKKDKSLKAPVKDTDMIVAVKDEKVTNLNESTKQKGGQKKKKKVMKTDSSAKPVGGTGDQQSRPNKKLVK